MSIETRAEQRDWFLRELSDLREEGAAFAARYPRVAGALDLGPEGGSDPDVERLIEAVAFLTARVQRNLDGQLPRLASGMLDALYPALVAPTPSMAIAALPVNPARARAAAGFVVPRGAQLTARTDLGAAVRLRTAWDVTLQPLSIAAVDRPDAALLPFLDGRAEAGSALRIRLAALGGERFADLAPGSLRFRLAGAFGLASAMLETLLTGAREVWAMDPGAEPVALGDRSTGRARRLAGARLSPVGFRPEEALLPSPPASHDAHRLVQEWFAFPDKFLFLDIEGLDAAAGVAEGGFLDLVLIVDAAPQALAAAEGGGLRLHEVPVVNLFSRISEPIRLDPGAVEYVLAPDAREERSVEVHSIDRVTLTRIEPGAAGRVAPFFGFAAEDCAPDLGWIARRAPTRRADHGGSDVLIAFRDRGFGRAAPAEVAFAHLQCTSRGLAALLPAGAGLGIGVDAPVLAPTLATKPTPQQDPPAAGADLWRLIAHLSSNRLALTEGPLALPALRESLALYGGVGSRTTARQVEGVVGLAARRVARRVGRDAWRGFVRGVEVTVTLDEEGFIGGSGWLFGAVLAQFFALHAGPVAFTELVLRGAGRDGEWARWPPMTGDAALL